MPKTEEPRLPEKMSDLIEVALVDLRKVERMKGRYKIDMEVWHLPNNKCAVCHAGAVMACTLNVGPGVEAEPEDFSAWNRRRLTAIDSLRCGDAECAGYNLGFRSEKRFLTLRALNRSMPHYSDDPGAYKRAMKKLAADLRAIGE